MPILRFFYNLQECFMPILRFFYNLQECFMPILRFFYNLQECFMPILRFFYNLQECFMPILRFFYNLQEFFMPILRFLKSYFCEKCSNFQQGIYLYGTTIWNDLIMYKDTLHYMRIILTCILGIHKFYTYFFPAHKLFAKKQWKGLGVRRIF